MSKYYIPKITEFYEGFEYEIFEDFDFYPEKTWRKFIFTYQDVEKINFPLPVDNRVRVKYLDKEDIESLGFKQIGGNWYHDGKTYQMIGNYKSLEISKEKHEHRNILFQGTVKNKSELKKLLKQLNITL